MALCRDLDWESYMDDLTEYAVVLVAFHFMLRSAEYCARLKAGKFDLDGVLRLIDIVFLLKGVVIKKDLMCADEVMVTKGKQKASDGGEQRRHSALLLNESLRGTDTSTAGDQEGKVASTSSSVHMGQGIKATWRRGSISRHEKTGEERSGVVWQKH